MSETGDGSDGADHLDDVDDGLGCAEVREELSGRRTENGDEPDREAADGA